MKKERERERDRDREREENDREIESQAWRRQNTTMIETTVFIFVIFVTGPELGQQKDDDD